MEEKIRNQISAKRKGLIPNTNKEVACWKNRHRKRQTTL